MNRPRHLWSRTWTSCATALVALVAASSIAQGRAQETEKPVAPTAEVNAPFDALLKAYVHDERLDYLGWRDGDAAALKGYLDTLATAKPDGLAKADQLAFWLNLYNATMIDAILARVAAGYSTADDEWSIFDQKIVRARGTTISLNHLEHEIVRKEFKDPRIHVALVCGARSCPPLLPRAYRGDDLDEVLDANMRRFVADPRRNQIDGDVLKLSKLFEWYADDFGGIDALPAFVDRYTDVEVAGKKVEFVEYSWSLNIAPPSGTWVEVTKAQGELAAGAVCERLEAKDDGVRVRLPFAKGEATVTKDTVERFTVR